MTTIEKLMKARRRIASHGVLEAARWALASAVYYPLMRWIDTRFDRKYGTETTAEIYPCEFSVDDDLRRHAHEYTATPDRLFVRFLKTQGLDYSIYSFVDLGCGKGRALLLAALFPFRRVIGVELEPRIHAICLRNIARFARSARLARTPEAFCMNAGEFEFPAGDLLLYLFNPFDEHVMAQVVANLRRSMAAEPRSVRIIYFHPNHAPPLLQLPNIKVVTSEQVRDRRSFCNVGLVTVYDVTPPAGGVV